MDGETVFKQICERVPDAMTQFSVPRVPWINRSTLNVRLDRIMIDYRDFRNALLTNPAGGSPAGAEPLYKLNANVLELFVSIWF